jgi:hypothetical protein
MSTVVGVPSGIYYISSQITQTVLTLTGGAEGTNLTAWARYDGPEQQVCQSRQLAFHFCSEQRRIQWNVTSVNELYTFRSVAYGNYISFDGKSLQFNPYTLLWARSGPYRFYLQEYKGGYLQVTSCVSGCGIVIADLFLQHRMFNCRKRGCESSRKLIRKQH